MNSLVRTLNVLPFELGRDFDIISVSINPNEVPDQALAKKNAFIKFHGRPETAPGWHFLTGKDSEIKSLAQAVGFRYQYSDVTKQYAHPAGIMILTPDGRLSRYIYGISYPARNVRLALTEASQNKIGTVVEQALLLCYRYDPSTGRYSFAIMGVVRVLGTLLFLALIVYVALMLRRDAFRRQPVVAAIGAIPPQLFPERDH
jgi:protein SCO1/2